MDSAAIAQLSRPQLEEEWRGLFGHDAPADIARQLLARILSHQTQARAHGGLDPQVLRDLAAWAPSPAKRRRNEPEMLAPGVRLVRVWRGEVYEVTACEGGFEYRGDVFRSLTRVARVITGTHWNGPMFFGLRSRTSVYANPSLDRS
ncbi:DUF2924 domain-containing protein [Brevundimonas sp. BR2-1]|uniref:DUF2924 domain-containing protein n=1 Tax=Brevundimonas sp. BR2-1 TaxID=3031123 RepID=UPI0030A40D13